MKFNDLAIGDRFMFEGMEYTKTSPILAMSQEGKPRMIRKSAMLMPAEGQVSPPVSADDPPTNTLDRDTTLRAFEAFYLTCSKLVGENPELVLARRKFLNAIQ